MTRARKLAEELSGVITLGSGARLVVDGMADTFEPLIAEALAHERERLIRAASRVHPVSMSGGEGCQVCITRNAILDALRALCPEEAGSV